MSLHNNQWSPSGLTGIPGLGSHSSGLHDIDHYKKCSTSPSPLPHPNKMVAASENFHDMAETGSELEDKMHLGDKYLFPYTGEPITRISKRTALAGTCVLCGVELFRSVFFSSYSPDSATFGIYVRNSLFILEHVAFTLPCELSYRKKKYHIFFFFFFLSSGGGPLRNHGLVARPQHGFAQRRVSQPITSSRHSSVV